MLDTLFKAYDIRGIVGEGLDEDLAYKIGRALVILLQEKQKLEKIAIAHDMRESSEDLVKALIKGINDEGVKVVLLGLSTTPMLNFAVAYYDDIDAGVMVTASHNPAEYNGFKITDINILPIGQNNGMEKLKNIALNTDFEQLDLPENIEKKDVKTDYLNYIYSLVDLNLIKNRKLKVAIDTANGVVSYIIKDFLKNLDNLEVIDLYWELDGTFPNHEANPLKHETLKDLEKAILENNCDLGIAFDGDGDRVVFLDEKANIWKGDFTTAVLAKTILKKYPKSKIFYDLRSSNIVKEEIQKLGGIPLETRVGHAFIKALMKEENAVMAGELSSHFYYKDFFNVESALLTVLRFLEFMNMENKKLSEYYEELNKYAHSGEINLRVNPEKKNEIFNEIVNYYQSGSSDKAQQISYLDGLKVNLKDWWFNLRFSNTEPLLRINMEAINDDILHEKKEELFSLLHKYL